MGKSLTVTTGSRLHFGLFSVGQIGNQPKFGGCGLMISNPGIEVCLTKSTRFSIRGIGSEFAESLVQKWFSKLAEQTPCDSFDEIPVEIEIKRLIPQHNGFGSGTQFALGLGTALCRWLELADWVEPVMLSKIMERGLRSAIGTHGFFEGGFLVDRGKQTGDKLAKLDFQIEFPSWPVMILNLRTAVGTHGPQEVKAFKSIPESTTDHRNQMIEVVKQRIAPAIAQADYESFGKALFEYGRTSGSAYASVQGGDFHSPLVEELVYRVRSIGVPAVGQSSWGPCVFAIARDDEMAGALHDQLQSHYGDELEITKTSALNQGAKIKWQDLE